MKTVYKPFHSGMRRSRVFSVASSTVWRPATIIGLGGVYGGDVLPLAEDGDPVGDLQHLVELVGDDDDGVALRLHAAEHVEELGCLLDGKDGGGLVQDDDLGPVVQHLPGLKASKCLNR